MDSAIELMEPELDEDVGMPLAKPRVALSAASPRSFLAVGFPLQSLMRTTQTWTRALIRLSVVGALHCGCSGTDELTQRNWIISTGEYLGKPIEFYSTDLLQFADANGNVNANLDFSEDGTVGLPGISCPNMRGLWRVENDSIVLSLDSVRYRSIDFSLSQWREERRRNGDSTFTANDTVAARSELDSGIFTDAMKIYSGPFAFHIKGEQLVLRSRTTRIIAFKDRTIDRMFEGL